MRLTQSPAPEKYKRARGGGSRGRSNPSSGGTYGRGYVSIGDYTGGRVASAYGPGGGQPITLPSTAAFGGRQMGGGSRSDVYGTHRYGSGYPYGGSGSTVAGRPFPFGFWPIVLVPPRSTHRWNNTEYGSHTNDSRPGGPMQQARFQHSSWNSTNSKRSLLTRQDLPNPNATAPYTMVGDTDSIQALMTALQEKCSVNVMEVSTLVAEEDPNSVWPEQILQYYRASSFGLALPTYNNTAILNDTATLPDQPFPTGTDMNFLACVNSTIFDSVPIMDAVASSATAFPMGPMHTGLFALFWVFYSLLKL